MDVTTWYFACDSDVHYGYLDLKDASGDPKCRKPSITNQILSLNQQYKLDFLLHIGDATDHGSNQASISCCKPADNTNEFNAFLEGYLNPIERAGIPVKLCVGNHDVNKWKYPTISVLEYIRDKHQGTYYWLNDELSGCYKFFNKNILFICLGKYPKNIEWLKSNLPQDKTIPIVIYYHFNTITSQPWSDWWSDADKEIFKNTIAGYNVKFILNGHWHTNKTDFWNGIPNVICAETPKVFQVIGQNITML